LRAQEQGEGEVGGADVVAAGEISDGPRDA
jgi:hypothetical protein